MAEMMEPDNGTAVGALPEGYRLGGFEIRRLLWRSPATLAVCLRETGARDETRRSPGTNLRLAECPRDRHQRAAGRRRDDLARYWHVKVQAHRT